MDGGGKPLILPEVGKKCNCYSSEVQAPRPGQCAATVFTPEFSHFAEFARNGNRLVPGRYSALSSLSGGVRGM
jgi:hypothetical protein